MATKSQNRKDAAVAINSSNSGADLQQPQQSQLIDDTGSAFVKSDFQQLHKIVQDLQATVQSQQKTIQQLQSGQAKLVKEVAEFKSVAAKLQATFHDMTTAAPVPVTQTSEWVVTGMREAIKRKKTVVVSGLQSVQGIDDATISTKFCENNLTLKPYVDQPQVKRVGKSVRQKLVVRLLYEQSAAEVLCRAKELQRASDPEVRCIYINPDMSREEAKAAYERRVARR